MTRNNNKKLLVQTYVKAICDLSSVKGKSSSSLWKFSDNLHGHLSALRALNQCPDNWGSLLLDIICTKLDANTISKWEIKTPKDELTKVDHLIEFLDSRFHVLEAIESARTLVKSADTMVEHKNKNQQNKFIKNNMSFAAIIEIKCYMCSLPDTIYKCPAFIALTVDNRMKKASELSSCKICSRRHEKKNVLLGVI